jgi:hypothetical protein
MLPLMANVEEVQVDVYATDQEIVAVTDALHRFGIDVEVRPAWRKDPESQSGNGAFWMTVLVLGVPAGAFLKGFFTKAGESAWDALVTLVRDLRAARRTSRLAEDGWIELLGFDETSVWLTADVPADAYLLLEDVDWEACRGKALRWMGDEWGVFNS